MKSIRWRAIRKSYLRNGGKIPFEFICLMRYKNRKKMKFSSGKELYEGAIKEFDKYSKLLGIEFKGTCSACMEEEGNYKNGMCKGCYEAMVDSNKPVSDEELDELIKEFETKYP